MMLFDEATVAELRQLNEDNLPFTVQLFTPFRVRDPGTADYITTWLPEPVQPCRLAAASAGGTNMLADQAVPAGDWMLMLRAGAAIAAGQQALVKGPFGQVLLLVERPLIPRTTEMMTKAFCRTVELTP